MLKRFFFKRYRILNFFFHHFKVFWCYWESLLTLHKRSLNLKDFYWKLFHREKKTSSVFKEGLFKSITCDLLCLVFIAFKMKIKQQQYTVLPMNFAHSKKNKKIKEIWIQHMSKKFCTSTTPWGLLKSIKRWNLMEFFALLEI